MTTPAFTPPAGTSVDAGPSIFTNPPAMPGIITSPPVVTSPAAPLTNVAVTNVTGVNVVVYVLGGTVTAFHVGATSVGTGGMYLVPAGQTITPTYTGTLTWAWMAV